MVILEWKILELILEHAVDYWLLGLIFITLLLSILILSVHFQTEIASWFIHNFVLTIIAYRLVLWHNIVNWKFISITHFIVGLTLIDIHSTQSLILTALFFFQTFHFIMCFIMTKWKGNRRSKLPLQPIIILLLNIFVILITRVFEFYLQILIEIIYLLTFNFFRPTLIVNVICTFN